jgi:hypothetical protein
VTVCGVGSPCAAGYVPAAGENVGAVEGGRFRTYAAVPTALLLYPVSTAMALMVSVWDTEIEVPVVYGVDAVVGVLPFTV